MIRLAIILVVSGFMKLPMATRCGAGGFNMGRPLIHLFEGKNYKLGVP
jgi:hypothetical protein